MEGVERQLGHGSWKPSAVSDGDNMVSKRLFQRLRDEVPDYEFFENFAPFHSSYDNWHYFGKRRTRGPRDLREGRNVSGSRSTSTVTRSDIDQSVDDEGDTEKDFYVAARVSRHALRLEREYKLAQALCKESDPNNKHFVKPLQFGRLPARQAGDVPLAYSIVEAPGRNYLKDIVELGPNSYQGSPDSPLSSGRECVSLLTFLNFAIGATLCCELLHHGNEMVHGEIRGDAFHYNMETGVVRMINFGSGARSFEHGLTSAGWSSLMAERGVEHKLQFIAPEQTGRLPAEPDSRTDIYSLGILFYTMLTGRPAFEGKTPLDVMQSVLSRRTPLVSTLRPEIPDAVSAVIQKMTQKNMDDRYNSASGVRHDMEALRRILTEGNEEALAGFKVATTDVSCFFNLPSHLVGRVEQQKVILELIDNAAMRSARAAPITRKGLYSLSSGSSIISGDRPDIAVMDDILSESTSSGGGDRDRDSRLNSVPEISALDMYRSPRAPAEQVNSPGPSDIDRQLETQSSHESRLSQNMDSMPRSGSTFGLSISNSQSVESTSLLRTAQKLKKKGHTEVIAICGAAGFGKSSLVGSIAPTARKYGYFTTAKFDQVRNSPFDPIIRIMSSLFRQIFSEHDVNTPFHENIRTFVKPFWGLLHSSLELPIWLLTPTYKSRSSTPNANTPPGTGTGTATGTDTGTMPTKKMCNAQANKDWLRSGGSNNTSRFMHIFLDVLRLLAVQKFICFCLDDLQFADHESLELLQAIVASHIPVVMIVTYRSEELLTPPIRKLLVRSSKISVGAFHEDETAQYVGDTLHRQKEYCLPLAAVIQEKTQGNPFFVREMLDAAYRNKCIYYCWKCSQWEYNLDRAFEAFSSPDASRFSSNELIARRLKQMPSNAQTFLAWAAMIGHSFSFNLIKFVMSCECSKKSPKELIPPTSSDSVAGLQTALSSFTVMATEEEDRFKFSHDRYLTAADTLCDAFRREEMHYVISCAMMHHTPFDPAVHPSKFLFEQARHVSESVSVIKKRAESVTPFRELLYQAAETARESGARSLSLYYFKHTLDLLADFPWDDGKEGASYSETLTLMTRAAEAYCYQAQNAEASILLKEIRTHARRPADKAPAVIIESRMYIHQGNSHKAFDTLRRLLAELGVVLPTWSWEECDKQFQKMVARIDTENFPIERTTPIDGDLSTLAMVLTELQSASFWADALLFYQGNLKFLELYLERGVFPHVGIAFVHIGTIAVHRFDRVQFGVDIGKIALQIFDAYDAESYVLGRGLTLHALFLGHLHTEVRDSSHALTKGFEASLAAGDKVLQLLNMGISAAYRVWAHEDLAEVEAFVTSITDEYFPDWPENTRGGSFLTAVRQYSRALQGKTFAKTSSDVMNDNHHTSQGYAETVRTLASSPDQPMTIYNSYRLVALCRYGYHKEVLALAEQMKPTVSDIWCMRFTYTNYFFTAISIINAIREDPERADVEDLKRQVAQNRARIETVASVNPVNYSVYLSLLDAEMAEINRNYAQILHHYEAAIDHAMVHGFVLDEAFALELYADFLVRRGASRPARGIIMDAISAYRRVGATGKAEHVSTRFEFLLYGTRGSSTQDAGTQTTISEGVNTSYKLEKMTSHSALQTSADRTNEWLEPHSAAGGAQLPREQPITALSGGLSAVGLDMIDLASILESSQLLSSELNVEKLLSKLTEIIVDSSGAELCGLVVEEDGGGWCVAAVGTPEGVGKPSSATPLMEIEDPVAKQVTLYVLRFKEQVFLRNVLDDERFANVPPGWLDKYPDGMSIIAIPILHGDDVLLGSLYCQAPPNTFTERTVTLLKLLVNQIAISIANALLFKQVEKVSARNSAMLDVQKQALAQARESEKKAKDAEAKAMDMVRLKDEAAKVKSMFLANVSHELRTPLNGVIGMSEMLKATRLNKEQEEHADSIRVCADTLLSVINDILDFSKLEAGKMQVFSVPLSLTETISEVVRALSYTNLERNLQTIEELNLDPKLIVMGDPVRLHQILMNLMSNAYKFTAKGHVIVRATAEREEAEVIQVRVSVTDTGIGISQEQQKKLFLPFSQADSSTARSYGGTGLGLSICKAIIENVMKGQIWLESKPGVGTTVSFSLPFKKVTPGTNSQSNGISARHSQGREVDPMSIFTPDEGPGARQIVSLAGIPRDQLKVCIAEDNPINQKIAINFVRKLGFTCEAFADGQQAVDALSRASADRQPFHLVLMDVQMPVLDGYNATREIRKHEDPAVRDVLVIAMTASAIRGDREKCLEAGMNNYLAKPVRADTLKQMLESYLHQPTKPIPNLQQEANRLVDTVVAAESGRPQIDGEESENTTPMPSSPSLPSAHRAPRSPERPSSARSETEIHLKPDEMTHKARLTANLPAAAQLKAVLPSRDALPQPPPISPRPGNGSK